MNKLLIITETDPYVENRLWHTLRNDFDYRVHRFSDIASDMIKILGITEATEESLVKRSLVEWADAQPRNQAKMIHSIYNRVRPLTKIGRNMCIMGVRLCDVSWLANHAAGDKIQTYRWSIGENQLVFGHVTDGSEIQVLITQPAELVLDSTHKAAVRAALSTLGLL